MGGLIGELPTQALANDPAFQRIAKGIYTLRALAPEINSPVPQPKTKGQRTPRPPPPRFDPSAFAPEPAASAFDAANGDDSVPLDFLDGSSVLAPMPAGARPEDVHVEEEYVEPVKEEAPENVRHSGPFHVSVMGTTPKQTCIVICTCSPPPWSEAVQSLTDAQEDLHGHFRQGCSE